MAQYDGSIRINTRINTDGISQGEKEIKGSLARMAVSLRKFVSVIGTAFAVGKLVQFGKEAVQLGSDLQEVQNVVDVTFTSMSEKVNEFAKNAAMSAGLSETMAKRYVGTFGAMSKSFGFTEEEAYGMSTALTQLSGDVASFYNITQDEAYTKLKSVFTGETETLKDLGVVMTQNALDAYAMANGFGKTISAMTEQEKVALRYRFVMDQLSGATGDFVRTSDSWANQTRILELQIDSLKATIGQGLINVLTPVIKVINTLLAKLATLANAFKAFTELITGNKAQASGSIGLSSDDGAKIGEGYDKASAGAENLANANNDAAKSAAKAAKAADKQLSTLDKLNNLSSDNVGENGGGGTGGMAGAVENVDYGKIAEGETQFEKFGGILDVIIAKIKELAGLFKAGFFEGLGDYESRFEDLKNDVVSIGSTLKAIFTSPEVLSSASVFANQLAFTLGQVVGSMASVGLSIAQNLIGGIEKYVTQNVNRIKQHIVSMLDIRTETATIFGNLSVALADIFSVFGGEMAQQITANLVGIFADVGMNVSEIAAKFGRDILNMIAQPIIDNKEAFKMALEGVLSVILEVTGTIKEGIDETFSKLNEVYDEHFKPFFDSIANGLSDTVGNFMEFWSCNVQPILDEWAIGFDELWGAHIQPVLNNFASLLGKVADLLKAAWENIIKPFIDWVIKNILPALMPIFHDIGREAMTVFGIIGDVISGMIDAIGGLIDFLTGVFTGDWSRAWNGIKDIFGGIWNGLVAILKAPVNAIIGIINGLVRGVVSGINSISRMLNSLRIDIPDWVPGIGGGRLGFNLPTWNAPQIPYLATGAVIPANKEFLAVLGDQKHGTNIEAPLATIEDAVQNVLNRNGGAGGAREITIKVPVEIDGKVLFELIKRLDLEQFNRTGQPSFQV